MTVICDVNWGSHGCALIRGHEGPCACDCCGCADHARDHVANRCAGKPPYFGPDTVFYGADAASRGLPTVVEEA